MNNKDNNKNQPIVDAMKHQNNNYYEKHKNIGGGMGFKQAINPSTKNYRAQNRGR